MRSLLTILLLTAMTACSHAPSRNPMAKWVASPNHNARQAILIVLHATEQDSVQESLLTLRTRNSGGRVSAHYLVGREGELYQLVSDQRRAWHAGGGRWGTITDVNSSSIGIELDNNGEDPFPPAQIASLLRLLDDLCTRLDIPRTQIIAHADMAPTRKRDPSHLFPWKQLADAGFGRWPQAVMPEPPAGFDAMQAMRVLGYPMDDPAAAIRAFHRHFRGLDSETGVLDADDARVLFALTRAAH
ncbi:MAG: N-acetylmuramoyl-L-alanine amidase [Luteimonas sp.]